MVNAYVLKRNGQRLMVGENHPLAITYVPTQSSQPRLKINLAHHNVSPYQPELTSHANTNSASQAYGDNMN